MKESIKSVSSIGKIADRGLGKESDSDRLDASILTQKEEEIVKKVQNIIGKHSYWSAKLECVACIYILYSNLQTNNF